MARRVVEITAPTLEPSGEAFVRWLKQTIIPLTPAEDELVLYVLPGTAAGTLKLMLRAGTGPAITILDNIKQDGSSASEVLSVLRAALQDGSVSSPAYSFANDLDLGLYRSGADQAHFVGQLLVGNAAKDVPVLDGELWTDVRAKGAVGDGVADDTQAFLDALSGNNNVYIPRGTYLIDGDALDVGGGSTVRRIWGGGRDGTIIKVRTAGKLFKFRGGSGQVEIRDLRLDGNGLGTIGIYFPTATESTANLPSEFLARNIKIEGFTTAGISTDATGTNIVLPRFEYCYIVNNGAHGIFLNNASAPTFLSCRFSSHTTADIELKAANNATLLHPIFDAGGARGLKANTGGGYLTVINPYFESKTVQDAEIDGPNYINWIGGFHNTEVAGLLFKNANYIMLLWPRKHGTLTGDFITFDTVSNVIYASEIAEGSGGDKIRIVGDASTIVRLNAVWFNNARSLNMTYSENVSDGATIAHGIGATPGGVVAIGSVAGEFVSVTAIDATNFTVAIKKHDGTAGTAQRVYWITRL